ncbi:MAG: SGNH/GDSL hydrolase family protein [Acidimicrobiales bacterium]
MRRTAFSLACIAVVGVGSTFVTTPALATGAGGPVTTSPYVALGDSYSSGAGILPQVVGSPPACERSQLNFAELIAAQNHPLSFTDVTCSGATTGDFYSSQTLGVPPQLDAVNEDTRLVTMTIGGNDENVFVDSFFGCANVDVGQPTGSPCKDKYGTTFTDKITNITYPNLVNALSAVRAKAPRASVVILGYPQILPPVGSLTCYAVSGISDGDVPWLVNQSMVLNDAVRRAADATGARYVDTYTPSAGHDECAGVDRWMEPLVGPINALPVHPNATGEAAMAQETLVAIG